MFVNRIELKAQLVTNNMTSTDLADFLGIKKQSLSLRMQGKIEFRESEIAKLKDKFGDVIFF